MKPGLYIVGTPIGNLEDISARALETLRGASIILAEDTRHTRILLDRYQIRAALISCHQFNEASRGPVAIARIQAGQVVALVTNAGMPGVSDPGARIVAACRKAGLPVTVIPGPSSITAAMALCGFITGGFHCEGFLPRKEGARKKRMEQLRDEPVPVVMLESPYRCLKVLADLNALLPARDLFLARELTKLHEECLWGTVADIYRRLTERHTGNVARAVRGEIVMVLAPASRPKREAPRGQPRGNLLRRSSLGYAGRVFAEPCEARNAIPACGNLGCQGHGGQEPQGFLAKKGDPNPSNSHSSS